LWEKLLKPSAATLLFGFFWCRHYSKLIYLLLSLRLDLFARLAAMSIYADVQKGPAIEVFALTQAFKDDSNPSKVNLSVGGKWRIQFPPPEECSYIHTCAGICVLLLGVSVCGSICYHLLVGPPLQFASLAHSPPGTPVSADHPSAHSAGGHLEVKVAYCLVFSVLFAEISCMHKCVLSN